MPNTANGSLEIGVHLAMDVKSLYTELAKFKKELNNLQPGTSGFKNLERVINSIERSLARFETKTSNTIFSANQLESAQKDLDKITESLVQARLSVGKLSFSDLKLTPEQTDIIKGFEEEINQVENGFNNFKLNLAKGLFAEGKNKNLLEGLGVTVNTELDDIADKVEEKIKSLQRKIGTLQEEMKPLSDRNIRANEINRIASEGLTPEIMSNLGGKFSDFFNMDGKGGFRFKKNAKGPFLEWLKSTFSSDIDAIANDEELRTAVEQGYAAVQKYLNDNASRLFEKSQKAVALNKNEANSLKKKENELSATTLSLNEYKATQENVKNTSNQIAAESTNVTTNLERIKNAADEYRTGIVSATKTDVESHFSSFRNSLQQTADQLQSYNAEMLKLQQQGQIINSLQSAISNFMGFYQVLNLVRRGVKEALSTIKELDTTMNAIAIVSDQSTADLWNQVDAYSAVAQKYGVSVKGAYEVSKIYYQAGYQTAEVMKLMDETLKLSKVSGLDYAQTTNYMMTALRGFKIEIQDAAKVVDVYSALAASTAVSQEELAVAMSKTASSMASVGATFEESSAMIATMVAVTRESATNIGTALKSVASRYGELTKNPQTLVDSEGEVMNYNKVDAALQSVGISLKTTEGQFRNFTDVILELSEIWDQLDTVQQRYIATQFAGNRQQSRFLALVSNKDLLKQNLETAENSEDIGTLQANEALDSLESKIEQVRVAYQQFYLDIGVEDTWKGFLDIVKNLINTLNGLPKVFNIPVGALVPIINGINLIRDLGTRMIAGLGNAIGKGMARSLEQAGEQAQESGKKSGEKYIEGWKSAIAQFKDTKIEQQQQKEQFKQDQQAYNYAKKYVEIADSKEENKADQYLTLAKDMQAAGSIEQNIVLNQQNAQAEIEKTLQKYAELKAAREGDKETTTKLETKAEKKEEEKTQQPATIPVDADTKQADQKIEGVKEAAKTPPPAEVNVEANAQQAQAEIEKTQEEASNIPTPDITPKMSSETINAQIDNIEEKLDGLGVNNVNTDDFKAQLNDATKAVEILYSKMEKSPGDFTKEQQQAIEELKQALKEISDSPVELQVEDTDTTEAGVKITRLQTAVNKLSNTKTKITVEANTTEAEGKVQQVSEAVRNLGKEAPKDIKSNFSEGFSGIADKLNGLGPAISMVSTLFNTMTTGGRTASGVFSALGGGIQIATNMIKYLSDTTQAIPWMAIASGVIAIINGIATLWETPAEKLERLNKEAEELNNKAKEAKANYSTIQNAVKKYDELTKKRYESAEAAEEYQEHVESLTSKFPELIAGFDDSGNAILNASQMETILTQARQKSAEATYDAAKKELELAEEKQNNAKKELVGIKYSEFGHIGKVQLTTDYKEAIYNDSQAQPGLSNSDPTTLRRILEHNNNIFKIAQENKLASDDINILKELGKSGSLMEYNLETISNANVKTFLQSQQEVYSVLKDFETIFNSDNEEQIYDAYMRLSDTFATTENEKVLAFTDSFVQLNEKFGDKFSNFLSSTQLYQASKQTYISEYQKKNLLPFNSENYISSGSILTQYSGKYLSSQADQWLKDNKGKSIDDYLKLSKVQETTESYNNLWAQLNERFTEDGQSLNQTFEKIAADYKTYSGKDIADWLVDQEILNPDEDLYEQIKDSFQQSSDSVQTRLLEQTKGITSYTNAIKQATEEGTQWTSNTQIVVRNLTSQYDILKKLSPTSANNFASATAMIIPAVEKDAQLLQLFLDNNINTIEGINAILKGAAELGYKDDDLLIKAVRALQNGVFENVGLIIQQAQDNILNTGSEQVKLIESTRTGIDFDKLDDFLNLAKNLGFEDISIKDFTTVGGKLVLAGDKYKAVIQQFITSLTKSAEDALAKIDTARGVILSESGDFKANIFDSGEILNEDYRDEMMTALGTRYSEFFATEETSEQKIGQLLKPQEDLKKALEQYYTNLTGDLAEAQKYADLMVKTIKQQEDFKAGDFSSLSKSVLELAQSSLSDLSGDELTAAKGIKENWKKIFDAVANGEEIIWDELEYIPQGTINILKEMISSEDFSAESFLKTGKNVFGATQQEINELLVTYFEKQRASFDAYTAILEKGIDSTLTFKEISDFAGLLNINLDTWIASGDIQKINENAFTITEQGAKALAQHFEEYSQELAEILLSNADGIISIAENAASYVMKGTNKVSDMTAFTDQFNLLMNTSLSFTDLFDYSNITESFILSASKWNEVREKLRSKLIESIGNESDVDAILASVEKQFSDIDFKDYLSDRSQKNKNNLHAAVKDYFKSQYKDQDEAVYEAWTDDLISSLEVGGQTAINAIKSIKGEDITSDEIEAAFRAQIAPISDAFEELSTIGINSIVSATTAQVLNGIDGFKVSADGVVISIGNLVQAYNQLYVTMRNSNEATTAELNKAFAQVLTSADQQNIDTLETLENAAGMTYEAFGELLTKYNIRLEDAMREAEAYGIEGTGLGKIRIADFDNFAEKMGWEITSQEYKEAYSQWVDSMASLQNAPFENLERATDQLRGLSEAIPHKAINVSYLADLIGENFGTIVKKYNGEFARGLLTISETTDIAGLINEIAQTAADAGQLLPEQIAELADAVSEIIANITSLISGGIKGNLNSTQVQSLQTWATQRGLGKLDFNQTAEGLQLSTKSAKELYFAMKQVDSLQSKILFDDLAERLQESDDRLKSISSTTAYIRELTAKADSEVNDDRKKEYQQELALAKEIYAIRGTQEDNSYNFMDQNIPAGQNNPLNYWSGWQKAFSAINESASSGFMEYKDFYNLITEMGNLAATTNKAIPLGEHVLSNAEEAANLIQQAAGALEVTSDGSIKINLSKIGIDFSSGAEDMTAGIDEGIHEIAQAQIDMLDSAIAMLEAIVAMEGIEDVAGNDMIIELPDIVVKRPNEADYQGDMEQFKKDLANFEAKYGDVAMAYTETYEKFRKPLLDKLAIKKGEKGYNEDFSNMADNLSMQIGNQSETLRSILTKNVEDFTDADAKFLNVLFTAYKNDTWDPAAIYQSMLDVFSGSKENITFTLPNQQTITVRHGAVLLQDEKGQYIGPNGEKLGTDLNTALKKLQEADIEKAINESSETNTVEYKDNKVTFKLNSAEVTLIMGDDGTLIGEDNQEYNSIDDYIKKNAAQLQGKEDITQEDVNKVKIKEGLIVIPEIQAASDLTSEQIVALKAAGIKSYAELAKAWGANAEQNLEFEAKYGFKFVPANNLENQAEFDEQLADETKTINVTVTYDQNGSDGGIYELLKGDLERTITVNLKKGTDKDNINSLMPIFNENNPNPLENAQNSDITLDTVTADVTQLIISTITNSKLQNDSDADITDPISEAKAKLTSLIISAITGDPTISTEGVATLNNKSLNEIDPSNITAILKNLGITTVQKLTTATGMSVTGGFPEDTVISPDNVTAILNSLGITTVNDLVNQVTTFPTSTTWGDSITATVSAQLASLGITGVDNLQLTGFAIAAIAAMGISLPFIFGSSEHLILTDVDKTNLLSGKKVIISDVVDAEGSAGTVVITPLKTPNLKDFNGDVGDVGPVKGASSDATINAKTYKIEFVDESGQVKKSLIVSGDAELAAAIETYGKGFNGNTNSVNVQLESSTINYTGDTPVIKAVLEYKEVIPDNNNNKVDVTKLLGTEKGNYTINLHEQENIDRAIENRNLDALLQYYNEIARLKNVLTSNELSFDETFDNYLTNLKATIEEITGEPLQLETDTTELDNLNNSSNEVQDNLNTINNTTVEPQSSSSGLNEAANSLAAMWHNIYNINNTPINPKSSGNNIGPSGVVGAKGNVALAAGTLMGELGPELWVSGGRYFVAGQNGAEFVNLPSDAIVFNHQQTASLLKNGKASRGKPVTNETNAISFAKGNINGGSAMAGGASAALAALKQLRAQWQSLLNVSAKDLAGAGGGGGGGGGGDKAFIKDLEKWYNWLQRIATLEKQINQYEAERSTIESSWIKNGYEYFKSQQQSLAALKEQVSIQADLTKSQQQYFNQRRAELNSNKNPFSSLYTFDENGQLVYKDGKLAELSKMVGSDKYRKANMSVEEQYKYITKTLGIDAKYLEYDNSGNKIEKGDYAAMVQAFWDKIDTDKNEMQSLYDSIKEGTLKLEELQQQQNELLQSMRDNQMDLEQKVYDAIIDERERLIDELEETKDAIEESNQKFIDGLNEALDKERQLYEKSENQKELNKLIRQRDILMRSGGSASEIANLNEEIQQKQFDNYLAKQEEQINAIQEASDKQIEKLDAQIELENELLEYQKKYGLLWEQVTKIMEGSPNAIANFIAEKNSEYWNKSPIAHEQDLNNLLFSSEQWAAFRDSDNIKLTDIQAIRDALVKEKEKGDKNSNKNGSGSSKKGGSGKKAGNNGNKNKSGNNTNDNKKKNEGKHYGYSISGPEQGNGKITIAAQERGFADEVSALIAGNMKLQNTNFPAYDKQKLHVDTFTYDKGGMVADTGMALLHAKESVLTAAQTNILRNDILGNKPDSLLSIFQTLQSAYANPGVNTYNSSNDSKTIQINKMELNLNVDKLANDYDSRQAARTVMDEMVRIASKTSANNSVRR